MDEKTMSVSHSVVSRTQTIFEAPHTEYKVSLGTDLKPVIPQQIVFTLYVPASTYVDGSLSWLTFGLENNRDGDINYSYGRGSAMNCIRSIQVIASDGQIIDDIQKVGIYKTISDRYRKGISYFEGGKAKLAGYNLDDAHNSKFCIPLNEIIPLFNHAKGTLLPSNLINGMRILITLAPAHELLVFNPPSPTVPIVADIVYTVSDAKIFMNASTMDGGFMKMMNSKTQTVDFTTYVMQENIYKKRGFNFPLQYTLAKAMKAFVFNSFSSESTNSLELEKQNMYNDFSASKEIDLEDFRFRIGNLYSPIHLSEIQPTHICWLCLPWRLKIHKLTLTNLQPMLLFMHVIYPEEGWDNLFLTTTN